MAPKLIKLTKVPNQSFLDLETRLHVGKVLGTSTCLSKGTSHFVLKSFCK